MLHNIVKLTLPFILVVVTGYHSNVDATVPLLITTWPWGHNGTNFAWNRLVNEGADVLDAVEDALSETCEMYQCAASVGPYSRVDESGGLSQDAMMMDGRTHEVGAVGALRHVRPAIRVARAVMKYTTHSLIVGDAATDFAEEMGFTVEDVRTAETNATYASWRDNNCQPNMRKNVNPDPENNCGPYTPINDVRKASVGAQNKDFGMRFPKGLDIDRDNHDTVCMVAIDENEDAVVGVTTNGLRFKLRGRVGDSPVPGAGGYVDNDVGGAAATGNGDIMIRFLPSYHAVEMMRQGMTPTEAAEDAVLRMGRVYPEVRAAVIAASVSGAWGAGCFGYTDFTFFVRYPGLPEASEQFITCVTTGGDRNAVSHTTIPGTISLLVPAFILTYVTRYE